MRRAWQSLQHLHLSAIHRASSPSNTNFQHYRVSSPFYTSFITIPLCPFAWTNMYPFILLSHHLTSFME